MLNLFCRYHSSNIKKGSAIGRTLFLFLAMLLIMNVEYGCNTSLKSELVEIPIDSIVIESSSANTSYGIIKDKSGKDSLVIICKKTEGNIFVWDGNKLTKIFNEIPAIKKFDNVFGDSKNIYALSKDEQSIKKFNYEMKLLSTHIFPEKTKFSYYSLYNSFQLIDSSFCVLRIPKLNISDSVDRIKYFSSKLLIDAKLDNNKINITVSDLAFPSKYKKHFYYDFYPISENSGKAIFYTYSHCDSIFLLGSDLPLIITPSKYSVCSSPFPSDKVSDYAFMNEYEITNATNMKLIKHNEKLILLQKLRGEFTNDNNELTLFDEQPKRILVFNLENRQLEYSKILPEKCDAAFSFQFKAHIVIPKIDEKKTILYLFKI